MEKKEEREAKLGGRQHANLEELNQEADIYGIKINENEFHLYEIKARNV